MAENYQRSRGVPGAYKTSAGGTPAESGPFLGEVTNNVDPTRAGRLQVYIEYISGDDKNNKDLWRTVSYISPYYGYTQQSAQQPTGTGSFTGNNHAYDSLAHRLILEQKYFASLLTVIQTKVTTLVCQSHLA